MKLQILAGAWLVFCRSLAGKKRMISLGEGGEIIKKIINISSFCCSPQQTPKTFVERGEK
jgi:hypothetical protein